MVEYYQYFWITFYIGLGVLSLAMVVLLFFYIIGLFSVLFKK